MKLMPGYKQTEIGVIPEDWEVVLLDSVAKRGSGHTPDKKHPEYWGGKIKWLSLQDTDRLDRLYIFDTTEKTTPAGIANSSATMHSAGTVVLSRDAGVGKSAIMQDDMAVSQHFMAWKCGSSLNNHFLYYWLQSNKAEFERIAMGNTIKTIGLPFFRQLAIPLPPNKAEQEAIAEGLSDADALINSLEQLIAKKRHIKQGAMQELLTRRKRLPGFCDEWEVKRLDAVADIDPDNLGSHTPSNYAFNYISVEDVEVGSLRSYSEQIFRSAPSRARRRLREGDILVATVRPNLKSHLLFASTQPNWVCSTGFSVIRCRNRDAHPGYVFFHLFGQCVSKQIEALVTGSNYPAMYAFTPRSSRGSLIGDRMR